MTKQLRNMWNTWGAFMDFFAHPVTIAQDAEQRKAKAQEVAKAADRAIEAQSYHKHLALSEIAALGAWEEGRWLK